jgi:hypothetical protein
MTLADQLPQLLPLACEWAEEHAALIQRSGRRLTPAETAVAARVGVARAEMVRIAMVDEIPAPKQAALKAACEQLSFLGRDTLGLTLGYGVYVRKGQTDMETLVAHELRHVAQYEERGSIRAYLSVYIPELLRFGYENAPMELDARKAEAWSRPTIE